MEPSRITYIIRLVLRDQYSEMSVADHYASGKHCLNLALGWTLLLMLKTLSFLDSKQMSMGRYGLVRLWKAMIDPDGCNSQTMLGDVSVT